MSACVGDVRAPERGPREIAEPNLCVAVHFATTADEEAEGLLARNSRDSCNSVEMAQHQRLYPSATIPSDGIPIVQGFIVGERELEVDAVPLLDVHTASTLGRAHAFAVVQRPSMTEALFGGACERSNIYDVYDGATGQHIFYAKERSECFWRYCCAPKHSFFVEFKASSMVPPQMTFVADIDASPSRTSLAVAWSIIARASSACPCPLAYCPAQSPSSSTSFHRTPALSR